MRIPGSFPVYLAASGATAHLRPNCAHLRLQPTNSVPAIPAPDMGRDMIETANGYHIPLCRFCLRARVGAPELLAHA